MSGTDRLAFAAALHKSQRLLGIDPGSKIIGLALSDPGRMIATGYGSLKRGKLASNAAEIVGIVQQESVGGLVIGYPLSMDGAMGPAAQAVRDWATVLSERVGLPFLLWDERLSSSAVNRFLISEMDLSRSKRAKIVDQMAATYILQAALDGLKATGCFRTA